MCVVWVSPWASLLCQWGTWITLLHMWVLRPISIGKRNLLITHVTRYVQDRTNYLPAKWADPTVRRCTRYEPKCIGHTSRTGAHVTHQWLLTRDNINQKTCNHAKQGQIDNSLKDSLRAFFNHFTHAASGDTLQTCPWSRLNRWWPQIIYHYSPLAKMSTKGKALFPFPRNRRGWWGCDYYQLQYAVVIKEEVSIRIHCSAGEIQVQQWITFTNRHSRRELYCQMLWRDVKSATPTQVQLKLLKHAEERCVTQCPHGSKVDQMQEFPCLPPGVQIGVTTSLTNQRL